jgi:predicted PurR-regulated permease PerM
MVSGASSTLGNAILTFVMGAYWLTSHTKAIEFITQLFSIKNREKVHEVIYEIESLMGSYVRGIVSVALFVGTANFLILLALRVPNSGTLGFIIGVTTLLPIVGGFLGGGAAVALTIIIASPLYGLLVLATFVGVQQIETHYLTPRTMARSTKLDPLLTILAVLIGFTLYGVIGAVIASPILGAIAVLLRELVIEPHKVNVSPYTLEDGLVVLNSEEPVVKSSAPPAEGSVQPN